MRVGIPKQGKGSECQRFISILSWSLLSLYIVAGQNISNMKDQSGAYLAVRSQGRDCERMKYGNQAVMNLLASCSLVV